MRQPHIALAHQYWENHLEPTDVAIDMTVGNGHDTFLLAKLLSKGLVVGFDIQQKAIEVTRERVKEYSSRVQLIHASHTELKNTLLPSPPRLIVYNLGYLPGGDKSITTKLDTTIESLKQALLLLPPRGALSITCYPGHLEGEREEKAVFNWAKQTRGTNVAIHEWPDRNRAPSLLWITTFEMSPLPPKSILEKCEA